MSDIEISFTEIVDLCVVNRLNLIIVNPKMSGVYKMAKHTLQMSQNLLNDFDVSLTISWLRGIIGLRKP